MAMLRTVIKDTRGRLATIEHELYSLHLRLSATISPADWDRLDVLSISIANYEAEKQHRIHEKKLQVLCQQKCSGQNDLPVLSAQHLKLLQNEKVVNLSSVPFSPSQLQPLNLGLNFALCKPDQILDTTCQIERAFKFSKLKSSQKDFLRTTINQILVQDSPHCQSNLTTTEKENLSSLKSNTEIVITGADKGGVTVILDKSHYIQGLSDILSNGPYSEVTEDTVLKQLQIVKSVVQSSCFISKVKKYALIPSNAYAGKMYVLPKIHKPILSFRPIVSCIGTAAYELSKFLSNKLSYLKESNSYSLKNSSHFVDLVHTRNDTDTLMVSFDIVSLFTKVPVDGALQCLQRKLLDENTPPNDVDAIMKLVTVCISKTYFSANQSLYCQTQGLPMGGPLSPLMCDIYLHYLEIKIMATNDPFLKWWRRYVDDVFSLCVGSRDEVSRFLDFLNSLDKHIQFTYEIENDNTLSFLDVIITKNETKFETTVYRKPFSVQLCPHARSDHVWSQKVSSFYGFVKRALHFCSTTTSLEQELNFLKHVAVDRGFDPTLIDIAVLKYSYKKPDTQLIPSSEQKRKPFVVLPSGILSSRIGTVLRPDFRVAYSPNLKLSNLFHAPKDLTPASLCSGIYRIPCQCALSYIGQTRRALKKRVSEHEGYVCGAQFEKSKVAAHSWEFDHEFRFSSAGIVHHVRSPVDLDFCEAFFITKFKKQLVNDSHFPFISPIWSPVIQKSSVTLKHIQQ